MEFLLITVLILLFFTGVFFLEAFRAKKAEKEYMERIRSDYLTLNQKEYSADRFAKLNRYLNYHKNDNQLDEITWGDCGMDELFVRMNYTLSAIGEEYLYFLLHDINKEKDRLEHFEELVQSVGENTEKRTKLQFFFHKLGYMGKYSIYDYLDNLDYLGVRSNQKHFLTLLLYPLSVALLFVQFTYGIIALVGVMLYHIMSYYKEKSEIEPYIISFAYIQKMTVCAQEIVKNGLPEVFSEEIELLQRLSRCMQPMNFASFLVLDQASGNRASGDIVGMILDYLKMSFHLDLIKFNSMYHFVEAHTEEVDSLITVLGYIESTVNTWIFRQSLTNGCCIPNFIDRKEIHFEAAYHPMLESPVKNSMHTDSNVLLTGSNASGKSTFLKTVAVNAILAQTIHTCSADSFAMPFSVVYSSMALRDDLRGGDSYYIVEIKALKRILDAAAKQDGYVLCFVDEILRGTNTVERIAASSQILIGLPDNTLCFAATHDIELTELCVPKFSNYHFEEEIYNGDVLFNYRLMTGKATTRNAIKLLELLGYDAKLISEASQRAEYFLTNGSWQ